MIRNFFTATLACGILFAIGCFGSSDTGGGVNLSGSVTLDGKPFPNGSIIFTPDASKKNSGAEGKAQIESGEYSTSASGGKSVAPGPTIVHVYGSTDESGIAVSLNCEFKVELPNESGVFDIQVPSGKVKRTKDSDAEF